MVASCRQWQGLCDRMKRISVGRAITIGMFWVNGTAMLGMTLPWLVIGLLVTLGVVDGSAGVPLLAMLALIVITVPTAWLGWSLQVPRWRLWAYRRVADIPALKSAAVSAGLIWPDGHFFERTEIRSRDQIEEMSRLEMVSLARKASGSTPQELDPPTAVGTAGKSLVLGLILMPVCVLAPAGLLSFIGIEVADSPIFLGLLGLFPVGVAITIHRRARRDGVSADEALRRMLPRGIRREDEGA